MEPVDPSDGNAADVGAADAYAVDGNAIGGLLIEIFGIEMTNVTGTCAHCGASGPVAEFVVYVGGPGTVARCRYCGNGLMVLVRRREVTCVDLQGLARLG